MKRTVALALAGFFIIGLAAADDTTQPDACPKIRSIDSWKEIDAEHAYIYTSPRRKYEVTFIGPCRDLKWAVAARLDTAGRGGTACLSPGDALLFSSGPPSRGRAPFEQRCTIKDIKPVPDGDDTKPAPSEGQQN